jgi:hypothetical protein
MPGGKRDSSKTRVVPVFETLRQRSDDWVRRLLSVPQHPGISDEDISALDLTYKEGFWGTNEHPFPPPKRLLEWLVRNPGQLRHQSSSHAGRDALLKGDQAALTKALADIEAHPKGRGWHLLEGTTFPDATLITPDAVIVIEGKRTEAGPTTDTSWLEGRHQIWRHIEGAWGMRGTRKVFGFFLVEEAGGRLPALWESAAKDAVSHAALSSSFPHLAAEERSELAACFIGVATWQLVCSAFGIDARTLPDTTDDPRAGA